MASVVEICNLALATVRSQSINNLNESSLQAQQCKLHYPLARDQVLKAYNWGFNHSIKPLAQLSGVEVFGWNYVWQYPSDCLHVNGVLRNLPMAGGHTRDVLYDHFTHNIPVSTNELPQVEYRTFFADGERVIVTNEQNARIDYRARVLDTNLYTPNVMLAIVYLLGSFIAKPLIGIKDGRQVQSDNMSMYAFALAEAKADHANESHIANAESEYITVRR